MTLDPITTHGSAAAIGIAACYAWVKAGPVLISKLSNGKNNGNGDAALELRLQAVIQREGCVMMGPVIASMSRMEAALTRMETAQNNTSNNIAALVAGQQAAALANLQSGRRGD
jgi:hypothetical protein